MQRGKRKIKDGNEYDHLFRKPEREVATLERSTDAFNTLEHMESISNEFVSDTALLAPKLRLSTLDATCRNIWRFVVDHINYTPDDPNIEQVRTPARSWADRRDGVDCDCYSVFVSTILSNLGISHSFRIADYGKGWQHVYVVVPDAHGRLKIIDPVLDEYDKEHPFKLKHDHPMQLQRLNGIGNTAMTSPSPYSPAYAMTVRQIQDQRSLPMRPSPHQIMGFGEDPKESAEEPSIITKATNWVKAHPIETGAGILSATLITIGGIKWYKGRNKKGKRGTNGLDGTKNRKRNKKGQFIV